MPVFTCSLTPQKEALLLARQAIDELRAADAAFSEDVELLRRMLEA
jgi:hypothetical protein